MPTASANKLPERKAALPLRSAGSRRQRRSSRPAAAERAAGYRTVGPQQGDVCLCRTCGKSHGMQEGGRGVWPYRLNSIMLLIFHWVGKCQVGLLFISFLSDSGNNEKSLEGGRRKNYQPGSCWGSCLLGSSQLESSTSVPQDLAPSPGSLGGSCQPLVCCLFTLFSTLVFMNIYVELQNSQEHFNQRTICSLIRDNTNQEVQSRL